MIIEERSNFFCYNNNNLMMLEEKKRSWIYREVFLGHILFAFLLCGGFRVRRKI